MLGWPLACEDLELLIKFLELFKKVLEAKKKKNLQLFFFQFLQLFTKLLEPSIKF